MTPELVSVAVKFIEQGGLYVVLGIVLLGFAAMGVGIVAVARAYDRMQTNQAKLLGGYIEKTTAAITENNILVKQFTEAIKVNADVSESNRDTLMEMKGSMDAQLRWLTERRR